MTELTLDAARRLDAYLTDTLVGHDEGLARAVADEEAAHLPAIEDAPGR